MKRAAAALRSLVVWLASAVGLEGAFLLLGTAGLAYVASFVHPAGAIAVVSVMALLIGVALAVPPRRA
jgi:hypothetical protein